MLRKLRVELQEIIPEDSSPVFSQIRNLPYLSDIIQEGLRLDPGVGSTSTRALSTR